LKEVHTIHKLSKEEISLLKGLIGKTVNRILCAGADIDTNYNLYEFQDVLNVMVNEFQEYLVIEADFDETQFGGDFNRLKLRKASYPVNIPTTEEGHIKWNNVTLMVKPGFKITQIEVHGFSGKDESDTPEANITEYIESEHILILHAKDGRHMLIYPDGLVPWMRVSFDKAVINNLIPIKNSDGVILTKLKKVIS
jgi:hypothetical protein